MDEPSKNKKRIVSQGQYAVAQANRLGCGVVGTTLFVFAVVCAVSSLWDYWLGCRHRIAWYPWFYVATIYWFLAAGSGYGAYASMKRARQIDPGIPVSRMSADTLPVEESLVRASEEPVLEQQAILLRAAKDNQETPNDQLLRPLEDQEP